MCSALAAMEEVSRAPPPGARAARRPVHSPHPRGRTPSGLERKEGIVPSKLNVFALLPTPCAPPLLRGAGRGGDRKSTRLNSSHVKISYAVFCLKKKKHT